MASSLISPMQMEYMRSMGDSIRQGAARWHQRQDRHMERRFTQRQQGGIFGEGYLKKKKPPLGSGQPVMETQDENLSHDAPELDTSLDQPNTGSNYGPVTYSSSGPGYSSYTVKPSYLP